MTGALRVLSSVQPRLLQHAGSTNQPASAAGFLVGSASEGDVIVTSVLRSGVNFDKYAELRQDMGKTLSDTWSAFLPSHLLRVDGMLTAEEASTLLPAGLGIIGTYVLLKQNMTLDRQATDLCICSWVALQTYQQLVNATTARKAVPSVVEGPAGKQSAAQDILVQHDSKRLNAAFTKVFCSVVTQLHIYGAKSDVPQSHGHPTSPPDRLFTAAISNAFKAVVDELCGSSIVLLASTADTEPILLTADETESTQACGTLKGAEEQAVNVQMLSRGTTPQAPAQPASVVYQAAAGGSCSYATCTLSLSLLCYVPDQLSSSKLLPSVIKPAIRKQLVALQQKLTQSGRIQPWTAFQVQPPGWPHCLTLMYPSPASSTPPASQTSRVKEEDLKTTRQALHARLGLPSNRPLLRFNNAVDPRKFTGLPQNLPGGKSTRLQDVHVGIPDPPVSGGTLHMIEGSYDYHHYMQDTTDDAGWGCAYRSLQTIHSWFRYQHYTQSPVPSFKDIQQTLVNIGDKPQAFVGSREWIGAIELGYILDQLLEVAHKVITVSSGADMSSKAREIAQHFDSQGTPIMIGGGVLAYTLLGISHNDRTGECAFLILDPHYTGNEDLARIQSGQWVAWKLPDGKAAAGGSLFVQNAFYNLLCPQRPRMI